MSPTTTGETGIVKRRIRKHDAERPPASPARPPRVCAMVPWWRTPGCRHEPRRRDRQQAAPTGHSGKFNNSSMCLAMNRSQRGPQTRSGFRQTERPGLRRIAGSRRAHCGGRLRSGRPSLSSGTTVHAADACLRTQAGEAFECGRGRNSSGVVCEAALGQNRTEVGIRRRPRAGADREANSVPRFPAPRNVQSAAVTPTARRGTARASPSTRWRRRRHRELRPPRNSPNRQRSHLEAVSRSGTPKARRGWPVSLSMPTRRAPVQSADGQGREPERVAAGSRYR